MKFLWLYTVSLAIHKMLHCMSQMFSTFPIDTSKTTISDKKWSIVWVRQQERSSYLHGQVAYGTPRPTARTSGRFGQASRSPSNEPSLFLFPFLNLNLFCILLSFSPLPTCYYLM